MVDGRIYGIRARTEEAFVSHVLELLEGERIDIELSLEVLAHLSLHLVDPMELEHSLRDDGPRLVGVGVVIYDL